MQECSHESYFDALQTQVTAHRQLSTSTEFPLLIPATVHFKMPPPDLISTTNRIMSLARSGLLPSARKLFDEMPERDTIAWNTMLTAYSRSGLPRQSLSLFSSMGLSGTRPDEFTLTAALAAASDLRDLTAGTKLHALALCSGFYSLPVANSIIDMYGKCCCPLDAARAFHLMERRNEVSWCSLLHAYTNCGLSQKAHHLFNEMPSKNTVAWNVMIMGSTICNEPAMSIVLFKRMLLSGSEADTVTFSGLLNACAELDQPCFGRMIHSMIFQIGWIDAVEISNSILSFYAAFGFKNDAVKIFAAMRLQNQVSWNAMINAHMKVGSVEEALSLFKRAPKINIISWTSMIGGFAKNGHGEEALSAFVQMMKDSYRPDDFTFGAVLHACTILAVLGYGKMVHSCVIQSGFGSFIYVSNGMVNMYAKCGDIGDASRVFDGIQWKDVVSWNAMILGFALHGWASKAFDLYTEMVSSDILPDKLTFLGLLMACSHSGLVEDGRGFFDMMQSVHGLSPDFDHVNCIIDMLGRAGHLKEASKLSEGYSRVVGERCMDSCEALLSACTVSGDLGVGKEVGNKLMRTEPDKEVGYVMLSNLYCVSSQWTEAEKVRKEMVVQGVKKSPGCSWIEVREAVKIFTSGSQSLTHMLDVHEMLGCLESQMRNQVSFFS